ncbi:MAG: transposase, partial [Cyanobacteria bacterium J083]
KRGLYQTKDKHLVSADINGAANILVKSKHRLDLQRVSSGFLANPLRIKIS